MISSSHDIDGGILEPDDPDYKKKKKELDQGWRPFRINHVSWWQQELPSAEELEEGRKNLAAHGNKVDFIVTHCCSSSTQILLGGSMYKPDIETTYLEEIRQNTDTKGAEEKTSSDKANDKDTNKNEKNDDTKKENDQKDKAGENKQATETIKLEDLKEGNIVRIKVEDNKKVTEVTVLAAVEISEKADAAKDTSKKTATSDKKTSNKKTSEKKAN